MVSFSVLIKTRLFSHTCDRVFLLSMIFCFIRLRIFPSAWTGFQEIMKKCSLSRFEKSETSRAFFFDMRSWSPYVFFRFIKYTPSYFIIMCVMRCPVTELTRFITQTSCEPIKMSILWHGFEVTLMCPCHRNDWVSTANRGDWKYLTDSGQRVIL